MLDTVYGMWMQPVYKNSIRQVYFSKHYKSTRGAQFDLGNLKVQPKFFIIGLQQIGQL